MYLVDHTVSKPPACPSSSQLPGRAGLTGRAFRNMCMWKEDKNTAKRGQSLDWVERARGTRGRGMWTSKQAGGAGS